MAEFPRQGNSYGIEVYLAHGSGGQQSLGAAESRTTVLASAHLVRSFLLVHGVAENIHSVIGQVTRESSLSQQNHS